MAIHTVTIWESNKYTNVEFDDDKTYWNHNGKFQHLSKQLEKLIPDEGEVEKPYKNKALERFRKASNCYYDLYNNGLFNHARSFSRIFKVASSYYGSYRMGYSKKLYYLVEQKMDEITQQAWEEQKDNL